MGANPSGLFSMSPFLSNHFGQQLLALITASLPAAPMPCVSARLWVLAHLHVPSLASQLGPKFFFILLYFGFYFYYWRYYHWTFSAVGQARIPTGANSQQSSPDWGDSVGWMSSCKLKGHWFDSRHMPGLQVRSPVGGVQETTDLCIDVSLLLFLPPFPSL